MAGTSVGPGVLLSWLPREALLQILPVPSPLLSTNQFVHLITIDFLRLLMSYEETIEQYLNKSLHQCEKHKPPFTVTA